MKNIKTPPCIITYAFVHVARTFDRDEDDQNVGPKDPEYSARLCFDKKKQLKELKELRETVRKFGKEKHGNNAKFRMPFRDGSRELEEGDQTDPFYEGKVFFNTRTKRKPDFVGPDNQPLDDPQGEIYSGCIVRCSVRPFAWTNKKGGKGVSLSLVNIKKLADGPRLDGGISAEDEFEGDDDFDENDIPFETVKVESSVQEDDDDDFFD